MRLIDTITAANLLGIKRRRVQQLFQSGTIPGQKIGRDYFADERAINAARKWLEKHGRKRKTFAA